MKRKHIGYIGLGCIAIAFFMRAWYIQENQPNLIDNHKEITNYIAFEFGGHNERSI